MMVREVQTAAAPEIDRREQVLAAAKTLFTTKGYETTTMADVAKQASVSVGTLYHYFESKRDLLVHLAMEKGREIVQRLFSPEILALPPEEVARPMIEACFQACSDDPESVRLLQLYLDPASETERWAQVDNQIVANLAPFLQVGMDQGIFNPMPAEMVARLLVGMVDAAMHDCFVLENGARQEEYKAGLVTVIERTLLRPERLVERRRQSATW
ncbi:MAG: TetR/AcrR family transcriptional regulator [Dehalococcoidia bacterium]